MKAKAKPKPGPKPRMEDVVEDPAAEDQMDVDAMDGDMAAAVIAATRPVPFRRQGAAIP